jgi:hypothetical protein
MQLVQKETAWGQLLALIAADALKHGIGVEYTPPVPYGYLESQYPRSSKSITLPRPNERESTSTSNRRRCPTAGSRDSGTTKSEPCGAVQCSREINTSGSGRGANFRPSIETNWSRCNARVTSNHAPIILIRQSYCNPGTSAYALSTLLP